APNCALAAGGLLVPRMVYEFFCGYIYPGKNESLARHNAHWSGHYYRCQPIAYSGLWNDGIGCRYPYQLFFYGADAVLPKHKGISRELPDDSCFRNDVFGHWLLICSSVPAGMDGRGMD